MSAAWTRARETTMGFANGAASLGGQVIFVTAVSVFFILSGHAARQGLQSLTMLGISTALLASRLKTGAKPLGYVASAALLAGAGYLAFGLPANDPRAFPLTLAIGGGVWLGVGAALFARGQRGLGWAARRPDAWTWFIGAATWTGISLTYANLPLVAAAGRLATYLWTPWAAGGFAFSAFLLPRLVSHHWPRVLPTSTRFALSMARGVAMALLVGAAVGLVVAQVGPAFAPERGLQAPLCSGCDPARSLLGLQAYATDNGPFVAAAFGARPEAFLIHVQGIEAPLEVRAEGDGWTVLGNGRDIDADTLSVADSSDDVVIILLQERALWRALAIEVVDGNRLPAEGFYEPRAPPSPPVTP